jgi:hypothetical protein
MIVVWAWKTVFHFMLKGYRQPQTPPARRPRTTVSPDTRVVKNLRITTIDRVLGTVSSIALPTSARTHALHRSSDLSSGEIVNP